MNETLPVFVNDQKVVVPAGGTAAVAVGLRDAALAVALAEGKAYLTDGRGIRLEPEAIVGAGAIIRVVMASARG